MGKSAVLLLLIGLAVGLWLGFNPATHRDLVRWWDRTTAAQARNHTTATPSAAISLRQLDRSISRWFRTAARPQSSPPEKSSPSPTWSQVVGTLQAFWHALEQVWVRFLLSLGIKRI